ncbi:hypothetical protein HYV81_04720 [Candidatus Woesearchaeota archaeon]|nr:hypothetical protein [Candidatus Woesearchaeota archaeon]
MANLKNQNQPRSVPLNIPSNIYRDANNLNYPPQQQPQESINQPQESMIKEPPLASSNKIPECETETDPEDKDTCYMSLSKTKKQCKNIQDFSIRQDCLDTTD